MTIKSNNIVLIGPMGAGKTTIGRKLAVHLKRPFIDVDETIERRLGVMISTIFDTEGEEKFRQREFFFIKDIFAKNQQAVIATGGGCVLTESCRKLIANQRLVVHIDVGLKQQYKRLRVDKKRPILQSGNLSEQLQKLRKQRHHIYSKLSDLYVSSDYNSFRKIINLVKKELS